MEHLRNIQENYSYFKKKNPNSFHVEIMFLLKPILLEQSAQAAFRKLQLQERTENAQGERELSVGQLDFGFLKSQVLGEPPNSLWKTDLRNLIIETNNTNNRSNDTIPKSDTSAHIKQNNLQNSDLGSSNTITNLNNLYPQYLFQIRIPSKFRNSPYFVHGAFLSSLCEFVPVWAFFMLKGTADKIYLPTTSFNIEYLTPVPVEQEFFIHIRFTKIKGKMIFANVSFWHPDNLLMITGNHSARVIAGQRMKPKL